MGIPRKLSRPRARAYFIWRWSAIILALSAPEAAGARQPFGPEDLWNWRVATDARISSDGRAIVYVESWNDRGADQVWSNLWLASTDGRTRKQWTEGAWR